MAIFILPSCLPLSDIMTSEGNPMPRFKASLPAHQQNTRIVPYRPLKLQWGNCIFNPPKPSKPFFSVGAYGSQPKSKRRATTRRWFAADAPKRKRGGGRTNRPPLRRSTPVTRQDVHRHSRMPCLKLVSPPPFSAFIGIRQPPLTNEYTHRYL